MEQKFFSYSTGMVDFPCKLALSIYFSKCNATCWFCFNKKIMYEEIYDFDYIKNKYKLLFKSFIDFVPGVVFTGGEPVNNLKDFYKIFQYFKDLETPISVHTNGIVLPIDIDPTNIESVVISLKTPVDVNLPHEVYLDKFVSALEYYSKVTKLRTINIVNVSEDYKTVYKSILDFIDEKLLSQFNIKHTKLQLGD